MSCTTWKALVIGPEGRVAEYCLAGIHNTSPSSCGKGSRPAFLEDSPASPYAVYLTSRVRRTFPPSSGSHLQI